MCITFDVKSLKFNPIQKLLLSPLKLNFIPAGAVLNFIKCKKTDKKLFRFAVQKAYSQLSFVVMDILCIIRN